MDIAQLGILVDSRNVRGASGDLQAFTRDSDRAESSAKRLGRTAVASLGAFASFATLQQAARHTLWFKAAMAEVSTLLDTQPGQMDALARSARNLAKEYGTNATSQAQAYYQAISAGASGAAEATRILDTANRLAIGGVTDVTTGVDILTTAMNAYRAEGLTAAEASDALFVGMRAGKTTISELSGSIGTVIPLTRAMGVSFDEVVAGTAALTTQGIQTSEAVTGLRAALTAVTNPSKQAADLADALGLKFDSQALAAKGLEGFLADVIEKTGGSSDAMATLFSSTEATTAALALAGGGSAKFTSILEDMRVKAGATATAFEKMAGDDLHRLNVVMSTVSDQMISLGGVVLSVGIPALEMLVTNMNTIVGVGSVLAGVFAARLAVSVGTTFVAAAVSAVKQSIALELALGASGKSAAFASVATKALSRSVLFLRKAVIATGIGALVVGAGFLVGKFLDLVKATGGWGVALAALGGVASGVWEGIKTSALSLGPALNAIWQTIRAGFFEMLSGLQKVWADFLHSMKASLQGIPKMEKAYEAIGNAAIRAGSGVYDFTNRANEARKKAGELTNEAAGLAVHGWGKVASSLQTLDKLSSSANQQLDNSEDSADALADALSRVPTVAADVTAGLKDAADAAKGFNETLEDAVYTAEEFGAKKADIMISGIDGVANAWGDFVASGFSDFKGFAKSVIGSFKSMLAQMIALAARNRIMISLGVGGVTGSAASLGSGIVGQGGLLGGGGSGLLGGLLGTGGGLFGAGGAVSGIATGLGGILSGGGLGSSFANLGGLLTGSVGGWGAIGAAIPAIGLVVAGLSLFIAKTKVLDQGIRVTVDGMDAMVETFQYIEKSRLFGLIKSRRTTYSVADAEAADPIKAAVAEIQGNVVTMASILGIGADAFADFTTQIKISTKGLSDEEIVAEIQKQLGDVADGMAELVLAEHEVALAGESASQTLTRLSSHLQGANAAFDILGLRMFDVSIAGADAASSFIQLFSSLDEFNQLTGAYFQSFYSEQERFEYSLKTVEETLKSLGFSTVPATHAQFRMLVDSLNEVGDSDGVATLLKIAPTFNEIANAMLASVQDAAARTRSILSILDRAFLSRLDSWNERGARARALQLIRSGDVSDEQKLEAAVSTLAQPSAHLFGNRLDYARDFAQTTAAIKKLRDETEVQLSTEEKTLAAIEQSNGIQGLQTNLLGSIDGTLATLSADIIAIQQERERQQEVDLLQKRLEWLANEQSLTKPMLLEIVQEVGRGGGLFSDHASYVKLNDGRTFSSKTGGTATELAHARAQAESAIQVSRVAYDAWEQTQANMLNPLRQQIIDLGGVPQFAKGGAHSGGWRVVGERGWELEHTGPGRVVSNSDARDMLDNREVVEAIEKLTKKVDRFADEQAQLGLEVEKTNHQMNRRFKDWDVNGMPATREETA